MLELGTERFNSRGTKVVLTMCPDCKKAYWRPKESKFPLPICFRCFNVPGREMTNPKGEVFVKLAEDDPMYSVSMKNLGFWGKGWAKKTRYVMSCTLGRVLDENEYVYHVSKDKTDNSPDNLTIRKTPTWEDKAKAEQEWQAAELAKSQEAYEAGYRDCLEDIASKRPPRYEI